MTPTTNFSVVSPSKGDQFWLAECFECDEREIVYFSPERGVTASRAETSASDWARDHVCNPSDRAARQQLVRDDFLNDRWAGDV